MTRVSGVARGGGAGRPGRHSDLVRVKFLQGRLTIYFCIFVNFLDVITKWLLTGLTTNLKTSKVIPMDS